MLQALAALLRSIYNSMVPVGCFISFLELKCTREQSTCNFSQAGMAASHGMLEESSVMLENSKQMSLSRLETVARHFVAGFFRQYITTGSLILLEEGGTMFTFEGMKKSPLKSVLKIHNPQFYWKVITQADLGFADAYINGDFTFTDKDEGLLNLFMLFIANGDSNYATSKMNKKSGWLKQLFFAASSVKHFLQHVLQKNNLTQARRNISRIYDLSNELYSLFMDDTMQYSCGVFKSKDEDLKAAQLRKMTILIEKARIDESHEVLEIGCGWGMFAVEVVKQTGCRYTGISLSVEQLKFAEKKVKDAGLEDRIKFLLCDYRQLPSDYKCDRIISCEMIEHVGHEFLKDFFSSCDSVLAENGLLVLQFMAAPDDRYDEYRRSPSFIREYIFPGGLLPSLTTVTSAMATSSALCVEHVENIGIHYCQTLRLWRKNFLENQREILALGFDENFIRTWEYYFDYCAAGFKSLSLGTYQVVFSRRGNTLTFNDQFKGFPSVARRIDGSL